MTEGGVDPTIVEQLHEKDLMANAPRALGVTAQQYPPGRGVSNDAGSRTRVRQEDAAVAAKRLIDHYWRPHSLLLLNALGRLRAMGLPAHCRLAVPEIRDPGTSGWEAVTHRDQ